MTIDTHKLTMKDLASTLASSNTIELNKLSAKTDYNSLLKELDISSLHHLHLRYDQLLELDPSVLSSVVELNDVYVKSNGDAQLDLIENLFKPLSQFKSPLFVNSGITSLHPDVFKCQLGLREIFLDNNNLTSLDERTFQGLRSLRKIILDSNYLKTLDEDVFCELYELERVSMNNNDLSKKLFLTLNLEKKCLFFIYKNRTVSYTNQDGVEQERSVNDREFIKESLVKKNFSLLKLFESTKKSQLAVSKTEKRLVDRLKNLTRLEALVELDLRSLKLRNITKNHFSGLEKLESIILEDNLIVELDPEAFHGLPNLTKLDLKKIA